MLDGRPTWTDCDEAGDYVVPNVLSPRDLVFRPDNMDETVPHTSNFTNLNYSLITRIINYYTTVAPTNGRECIFVKFCNLRLFLQCELFYCWETREALEKNYKKLSMESCVCRSYAPDKCLLLMIMR